MNKESVVQPHDVHKSIKESFEQVKLMKEGKMEKILLKDLFGMIEEWNKEEGSRYNGI